MESVDADMEQTLDILNDSKLSDALELSQVAVGHPPHDMKGRDVLQGGAAGREWALALPCA
jgi:hypothetical protein